MTELTISLLGAGSCFMVDLIDYNFWQEYKARKKVERAFGNGQDDVLMREDAHAPDNVPQRQEPSMHTENAADTQPVMTPLHSSDVAQGGTVDTVASHHSHAQQPDVQQPSVPQSPVQQPPVPPEEVVVLLPIDEFIDCVIPIEFDHVTRGDKILAEIQSLRRVGNKPVHFVGQSQSGAREVIVHAGNYSQLYAGVQLVSRSGALNELEYSELVMKLRQIADNLNGHPDIPDMQHVMDAGQDLHHFVTEHDAQLSVNVHTNDSPWELSTLLAALTKHGFAARPDGRLVMLDGDGGALFTLSMNSTAADQVTKRITLLLDVSCVAPERHGFQTMVACAKSLALRLGGTVVDDSNQILNDTTLAEIEQQVAMFYQSMQAADIPAGSVRALRLFS